MLAAHDAQTTASELVGELASEIKGKVVLTTGVSPKGLGAFFVEAIAKAEPTMLILAGRNTAKTSQTADAVKAANTSVETRVLELDLGSLAAVRRAADVVRSWADVSCIDVLVNNAGIMAVDFKLSPEGYENQLATNYLGPFLFTNLILDKIIASSSPRVVNVSSDGHRLNPIRWYDYNFEVSLIISAVATDDCPQKGKKETRLTIFLLPGYSRAAPTTTNGTRMGNLRRRTCYLLYR
jgi:flavin-binding protein dodecin